MEWNVANDVNDLVSSHFRLKPFSFPLEIMISSIWKRSNRIHNRLANNNQNPGHQISKRFKKKKQNNQKIAIFLSNWKDKICHNHHNWWEEIFKCSYFDRQGLENANMHIFADNSAKWIVIVYWMFVFLSASFHNRNLCWFIALRAVSTLVLLLVFLLLMTLRSILPFPMF